MKHITREFIRQNPKTLFLFGDNDIRKGLGGMAKEFRGEPNTIGIRTKHTPSMDMDAGAFYTDEEYLANVSKILDDMMRVLWQMEKDTYISIWIPDSLGTGLAKLREKAPRTLEVLQVQIEGLKEIFRDCIWDI